MAFNNVFGTKRKNTVQDILEAQREARAKQANMAANSYQQRLAAGDDYAGRDYALSVLGTFLGRKLASKYKGESPEMVAARANDANVAQTQAEDKERATQAHEMERILNMEKVIAQRLSNQGYGIDIKPPPEVLESVRAGVRKQFGYEVPQAQSNSYEVGAEHPVGDQSEALGVDVITQGIEEGSTTSIDQMEMDAWFQKNRPGDPFMVMSGLPPAEREEARRAFYKREVLGIKQGNPQGKGGMTAGGTPFIIEGK